MKWLALFLLSVSAMCIGWSNARFSYYPLLKTRSQGLSHIQKRQLPGPSSDQERDCSGILIDAYCTNGHYQEFAELQLRCNDSEGAQVVRQYCGLSPIGETCYGILFSSYFETFLSNAERACSTTSCTSECRSLLTNARNDFGCCINLSLHSVFSNSQWSACGIERITENCADATFDLEPIQVDRSCSTDEDFYNERTNSIACRREYVEDIRKRLSEEGECEEYGSGDFCHANRFGTYCELLSGQNITEASVNCMNTNICEPRCIETLENISSTAGCCFNDKYNSSSSAPRDFLSYEFWSRCNLTPLGRCEEFLNNAAIHKASIIAVVMSAITLAVTPFL